MSGEVVRALSLKYIVMMQAGYKKAMQPTLAEGVVGFRVNKKGAASQNRKKKKGKVEQSVTNGIGLDRKMFGSCNMM